MPLPPSSSTSNPNRLSSSSSLSSGSHRSSLSSSSNGRLGAVSSRLSINPPDNRPFLPGVALGGGGQGAGGGTDSRPNSSLSRSWGATEQDEDSAEEEWADADELGGAGQLREDDGEEEALAEEAPSTPIHLPRQARGDNDRPHDAGRDSYVSSGGESAAGGAGLGGEGGLGILGLGVGPSSFSSQDSELRRSNGSDFATESSGRREGGSSEEQDEQQRWKAQRAEQVNGQQHEMPFPALTELPPVSEVPAYQHSLPFSSSPPSAPSLSRSTRPSLVSQPSIVSSTRSPHPSLLSNAASSNSSTLSLPTVPPVDLNLPNVRPGGTFVSVANSMMGSLAANNPPINRNSHGQSGGARYFFSHLLNRSPRANSNSPRFSPSSSPTTSPNPSNGPPRSPSAPLGWQYQHPSVTSLQSSDGPHTRSTSMPTIANVDNSPSPRDSSDIYRPESRASGEVPQRRTPRAIAAATFAGLTRSNSVGGTRGSSSRLGTSPSALPTSSSRPHTSHATATHSPAPTIGFATPPLPSSSSTPAPPPPTLSSIGLNVVPLTQPLSLSRNGQPLCGALLDNKYLLIGTTTGLDFLPLPLPGSLPMKQHGTRKRKETRKPISLIKRTRFKELAVLSERSNILLAIAGRNDHIRVYALDGIRSMIEKKMQELDIRDGYPIIPDGGLFEASRSTSGKGKARAASPAEAPARPISTFPPSASSSAYLDPSPSYQFPPPDYTVSAPSPRRRPPSWHQNSANSLHGAASPSSPVRISSRSGSSASFVRAVPTNPTPRGSVSSQVTVVPGTPHTLRGQKSRDFLVGRKGSTATVQKRRSRADLQTPPLPGSRRSSFGSSAGRRPSAMSDSGWITESSPIPRPTSRMEPRAPIKPQNPLERSPTSDLAEFLRDSGPDMHSPEMDNVLATSRQRRRSSVTDSLLQASKDSHLFPSSSTAGISPTRPAFFRSVTASHLAGLALYTDDGDGGPGELVEMLQESAAEVARETRRASVNDFRKPMPREATSPLLQQTERSPALELAELIRETGPPGEKTHTSPVLLPKPSPREAASPRLPAGQKSPAMELAALLSETGPDELLTSSSASSTPPRSGSIAAPSKAESDAFTTARPSPPPSAAVKGKAPADDSASTTSRPTPGSARLIPRSPVNLGGEESTDETDGEAPRSHHKSKQSLAEAIRAGPPPGVSSASSSAPPTSTGQGLGISSNVSAGGTSPSNRSSKRWTMSGVGSLLSGSRPRSTSQSDSAPPYLRPASSVSNRTPGELGNSRSSLDSRGSSWEIVADPTPTRPQTSPTPTLRRPPPPVAAEPSSSSTDVKRRPTSSLHRHDGPPSIAPSSQAPPDAHPANSASPLEYVKLARTKGARLLRAVETKKRTYLAVLCGEDAERIELFTGSRSISLSLNRTFVLPETPRTVEFQLQGDELVDIYLVYGESIFALEPATVRVREVGVGRGERRARRERERRLRNLAATTREEVPAESASTPGEVRSPALHSALHPADPALREGRAAEDSQPEGEDLTVPIVNDRSRSPSPSPGPSPAPRPRAVSSTSTQAIPDGPPPAFSAASEPERARSAPPAPSASADDERRPSSSSRSSKQSLPYSTFQQLTFVPPVPSAVLSSAWTIPPLYTDVVAGSPAPPSSPFEAFQQQQPSIRVTGENGAHTDAVETSVAEARAAMAAAAAAAAPFNPDLPLLSPVSLLGGAALRQNGPPGLFFVSKGKNLSGIVTADGKSIIKRPLVWSHERSDPSDTINDVPQRIEVLVVGGKRTVVVKLSATDVKCISVEGASTTTPFSPAVTVSQARGSGVQFLATHRDGQQLLFAETVGSSSYVVRCLAA
ncbi:hypothetical protein JCM8547_007980 [Rhodosporidiobolus lusitaniae]